jgi:hypothetical protein
VWYNVSTRWKLTSLSQRVMVMEASIIGTSSAHHQIIICIASWIENESARIAPTDKNDRQMFFDIFKLREFFWILLTFSSTTCTSLMRTLMMDAQSLLHEVMRCYLKMLFSWYFRISPQDWTGFTVYSSPKDLTLEGPTTWGQMQKKGIWWWMANFLPSVK